MGYNPDRYATFEIRLRELDIRLHNLELIVNEIQVWLHDNRGRKA